MNDMKDMPGVIPIRSRQIAAVVLAGGHTKHVQVVAVHAPEGFQGDLVAVVRYQEAVDAPDLAKTRWGVVQRVGPVWSSTLGLTATDAAQRALVAAGKDITDDEVEPASDDPRTPNP